MQTARLKFPVRPVISQLFINHSLEIFQTRQWFRDLHTKAGGKRRRSPPCTLFAFELKLLNELGLRPHLDKTKLNPGTRNLVQALTENDWSQIARLKSSPAQAKELNQFLHGFLIFHLGKIPKGRNAALHFT